MKNATFLFFFLLLTFNLAAQEQIPLESEILDTLFFELDHPSLRFIDKKGEWDTTFLPSMMMLDIDKLKKKL